MKLLNQGLLAGMCCVALGLFVGCEKKEPVVDVETPIGDVKVDKTTDPVGNEGVEVDVDAGKKDE